MDNHKTAKIATPKRAINEKRATKKEIIIESARAVAYVFFGILLGTKNMLFETTPLAYSLLAAGSRQAPFVLVGIILSAFGGGEISFPKIVGGCVTLALRIFARLFLDNRPTSQKGGSDITVIRGFSNLFDEHTYLKMMSSAVGVFSVGIWNIVAGGFRFYDLFGAIFYLVITPIGTLLFSWYFEIFEQRARQKRAFSITPVKEKLCDLSAGFLIAALIFSLDGVKLVGISTQIFIATLATLYACKKGIIYGMSAGLLFGLAVSPIHAPTFAFCAIAYVSISKISRFGASVAACIVGLVWGIYVEGLTALGSTFPALLSASMLFCTAERIGFFEDVERFFDFLEEEENISVSAMMNEQKITLQDEKLKALSDSFSTLSEIFYNLSSKLKRPTMLDLHRICEASFEKKCAFCESREVCYGTEYSATLEAMKKITVKLHSSGATEHKNLSDEFKKRCPNSVEIIEDVNKSCAIATKKALQTEKTEIFALDYDAISKILNDALAENDEELKSDPSMAKKLARVIASEGYGEHSVSVFGKRKLRIMARGLDLSERAADVTALKEGLEKVTRRALSDPTFELAFGSVNMQICAKRAYSAECAFATANSEGERICGDTVSIFENKNDYLYALISDGMGTGQGAALVSELANAFLRNMLTAGNKMETSLKMLNSVLRAKGVRSENECSATVDLLQFDLYSGALTLIKSGAAPTLVVRRGNVFKLSSPSFPIGILNALDAKQIDISCEDGDIIVMLSDGAFADGEDHAYLTKMLRDPVLCDEEPSAIADKIIRRAKAEMKSPTDDISVIVVRIKREMKKW